MEYWFDYVKGCYDLVIESEGLTKLVPSVEVESYIVHLMAKNIRRTDIGKDAIAIKMLEAVSASSTSQLLLVADECLLIQSFPLRQSRWPTETYYQDMGIIAYGLANHIMEYNFVISSKILAGIFRKNINH